MAEIIFQSIVNKDIRNNLVYVTNLKSPIMLALGSFENQLATRVEQNQKSLTKMFNEKFRDMKGYQLFVAALPYSLYVMKFEDEYYGYEMLQLQTLRKVHCIIFSIY